MSPNLPRDHRTPLHWFNTAAFTSVPTIDPVTGLPEYGNAARNIIVGPGLNTLDASLSKIFPILRDRGSLSFRIEAYNLFNHPNFDFPDANISNTNTVGVISNTVISQRQAQFAVRYDF